MTILVVLLTVLASDAPAKCPSDWFSIGFVEVGPDSGSGGTTAELDVVGDRLTLTVSDGTVVQWVQ